jgi:hypothetical protein
LAPLASRGDRRRAEVQAGRRLRRRRLRQGLAVLAALAIAAVIVLVLVNRDGNGPAARATPKPTPTVSGARLAQPDLATSFIAGAASDIAAVTTYDYRSLDDALAAGSAVTTGAYRRAYRAALTGDLAATARQNHVVHTFETLELGVGEMNAAGTQAKVLVFGRERVTDDSTRGDSRVTPSTLCATIQRAGNRYLISNLVENANAGLPPGGPDLRVAAEAGRSEVVNLLSYRRADFDADVQRAVAGAVSPLSEQIQANATDTGEAMRKGNYDLSGAVTAVAVERASDESVVMLVAGQSTRVIDGAPAPSVSPVRYVVTVTRTDRGWAVSQVRSVDGP